VLLLDLRFFQNLIAGLLVCVCDKDYDSNNIAAPFGASSLPATVSDLVPARCQKWCQNLSSCVSLCPLLTPHGHS
jgi:hypothetical protein